MLTTRFLRLTVATGLLFPLVAMAAGIFPDVRTGHPYKEEIESLARAGIIKGNPDGKYSPERSVNRVEFLKLLYTATERTPAKLSGCFSDVEAGSWYENYVCDAASEKNRFVAGYSDGKFRPASPVNRTEALKMVFTVFGLPTPDLTTAQQDLIKFVDVPAAAWYTKYMRAAYIFGVLPIAGQTGSRFYPDKELTRGEAAAYIFNAIYSDRLSSSSSSTSSLSVSAAMSSSSSVAVVTEKNVSFPFSASAQFTEKMPMSYLFTLTDAKTLFRADVSTTGFYPSDITCRLYLLKENGFSDEYYLGVQSENTCRINVALRPGSYQLQLQPTVASVAYTVVTSVAKSDGNDGFMEAVTLLKNLVRTSTLEAGDLYDWYSITVNKDQMVTVGVTAAVKTNCIIYTPPTVDQFGFTGPECGKPYTFVGGETYIVGIGRENTDLNTAVTYTISWQ